MTLRRTLLGAVAAALTSLAAPAAEITDVLGRTVTVPDDPQRILVGFYFEDFYAVGGPDAYGRVVAISRPNWEGWRKLQWDAYVARDPRIETLVDVGDVEGGTFSLEAALAARPDLAILAAWQYSALGETAARMEAAGVPILVLDYNAQTVERHVASTLALGAALGTEDRAKALADEYAAAVAAVLSRVTGAGGPRRKVYVELGQKGAAEVGNSYAGGMWGGVIGLAGGENIAEGQISNWGPLSPEHVLASNPDMVLLAGADWVGREQAVLMGPGIDPALTRERMRPYVGRPGWSDLNAVRTGEVHAIYHGGARTLYDYVFLQYVAKALHPEAFADVDPQANLDRFFARWMPIPFSGTYFVRLD